MDFSLSLAVPVILVLSFYPLVNKISYFRKLSLPLRLCLSFAAGISFLLISLSLWGIIFPHGFKVLAKIIFISGLAGSLWSVIEIIGSNRNAINHKTLKSAISGLLHDPLKIFLALYISIFLAIFILRPVVDADITDSYLPLARSIIIHDNIPSHNYYDNRPFIIPPVGGPVLFAFYYALAGNIKTEAFKFINIPSFLGFLIMTFYLLKKYLPDRMSLIGVFMVSTIPLLEDLIFSAGLYPDFIFSFTTALVFWLLTSVLSQNSHKQKTVELIIIGFVLTGSLLLKYQAVFLYMIVFFILLSAVSDYIVRFVTLPLIFTPLLISHFTGGNAFVRVQDFTYLAGFIILLCICILYHGWSDIRNDIPKKDLLISLLISLVGFSFLIHTSFSLGGVTEKNISRSWAISQEETIGVKPEGGNALIAWFILLSPALAIFWFIPKIIGLYEIISNRNTVLPVFILIVWYIYWVIVLGGADPKWLLPISPYLALLIILGLKKLYPNHQWREKIIYAGIIFTLVSSKFIFWNLGALSLGSSKLRQVANNVSAGKESNTLSLAPIQSIIRSQLLFPVRLLIDRIETFIFKAIYLLTSRDSIHNQDILLLILFAVLSLAFMSLISRIFNKYVLSITIILMVVISYGLIFYKVSGGNVFAFSPNEQKLLFNYWGQNSVIIPYLKSNAKSEDVILTFSIPTGLSYYTGLHVYNLQYGGGLSMFYSVFNENNSDRIYEFYKKNHIRFVIIQVSAESQERFELLKKTSRIFDVLDNGRYSALRISPTDNISWEVYEIL